MQGAWLRVIEFLPLSVVRRLMLWPLITRWMSNGARIAGWNRLGSQIDADCYIDPNLKVRHGSITVGAASALDGNIEIAAWEQVTIGRNVMISPGCYLLTGGHDVNAPDFVGVGAPIVVEDNVWLATGAVILPGVAIGEGAVVGAFSVVPKDVPSRTVVAGNPAQKVTERAEFVPRYHHGNLKRYGSSDPR
jgi:acetyltransferase-like isoleucine patch superfamily enzyme